MTGFAGLRLVKRELEPPIAKRKGKLPTRTGGVTEDRLLLSGAKLI